MKKSTFFAGLVASLLLVGCGQVEDSTSNSSSTKPSTSETSSSSSTVVTVPAESVTITGENAVSIGKTVQLTATVAPETTTNKTVTWSSDNAEIATVDENGLVTGVAEGKAKIKATCGEKSFELEITVSPILPTKIELNDVKSHLNFLFADTKTIDLTATVTPADTTNKGLVWSSSDENVATVDENGKVTVKALGEAKITVKSAVKDSVEDSVTLHSSVKPTGISFEIDHKPATKLEMDLSGQVQPYVKYEGENAYNGGEWTIENPEVAEVTSWGAIKAKAVGKTKATFTSSVDETIKATLDVEVFKVLPIRLNNVVDFENSAFATGYEDWADPKLLILNNKNVTMNKKATQFNSVTKEDVKSKAAILQASNKIKDDAYLEFDFGTEVVNNISFDMTIWSAADKGYVKGIEKIAIQQFVGDKWVDVKLCDLTTLSDTKYVNYSDATLNSSKVRITITKKEDASTSKNCRICIDNIKF